MPVDSSFWFGYLVSAILATVSLAVLATVGLAVLATLATRLLAVAAASGALDEVTYSGIEMTRNAATDTVYTARSDTYNTLRCISNSAN
jgi:hypothetical protein